MKKEQKRFTAYAEIYVDKAAEDSTPDDEGMTPAAKATKIMGSRKNKFPENRGLSQAGKERVIRGRQNSAKR